MKLDINNYPGSKGGSVVYQWIINHIPRHHFFIELFAGSGVITEKLNNPEPFWPAICELYEKSEDVACQLNEKFSVSWGIFDDPPAFIPGARVICVDVFKHWDQIESEIIKRFHNGWCTVIYADPPYLHSTRRDQKTPLYEFEWTEEMHREFLRRIPSISQYALILISGYDNDLYNEFLKDWYTDTFNTMTRVGSATEKLWMNFKSSDLPLHNTAYYGHDFVSRQFYERKRNGFAKKFKKMPLQERQMIIEAICAQNYCGIDHREYIPGS